MPRTFIAFEIDPVNQKYLANLKDRLNWGNASIKWVKADNIHLTLKFLGDLSQSQIDLIKGTFPKLFTDFNPVAAEINRLGAFPNSKHPKVLWAGLTGKIEAISVIVARLEQELELLGFPKEQKKFSSHITIGRVRFENKSKKIGETLQSFCFTPPLRQNLNIITLYESTLTPQGPIYVPLVKTELADTSR
ncbi:MAG: RNA 2',3'-cyclic phosphodiesterase [Candidatus Omnitrophota bacterium]